MRKYTFLNHIKQKVASANPTAKVILFGSRVRNNVHGESDWDLLILLDKKSIDNSDFENIAYPIIEYGWKNGEQVSPKLYTFTDWEKRSFIQFYKNIKKEGIVL